MSGANGEDEVELVDWYHGSDGEEEVLEVEMVDLDDSDGEVEVVASDGSTTDIIEEGTSKRGRRKRTKRAIDMAGSRRREQGQGTAASFPTVGGSKLKSSCSEQINSESHNLLINYY